MSVALCFYLLAFFAAKKFWKTHVFFALKGFTTDIFATYLMFVQAPAHSLFFSPANVKILLHTILAVAAILAFFIQAGLGLAAKTAKESSEKEKFKGLHVASAKYFFLPL